MARRAPFAGVSVSTLIKSPSMLPSWVARAHDGRGRVFVHAPGGRQHVDAAAGAEVERLGDLGHPDRLRALDVGVDDRLAARLAGWALGFWGQLQIDRHQSTPIN